jgi:hypothetical protein
MTNPITIKNARRDSVTKLAIWKFPFDLAPDVSIEMPTGAEILSVQVDNKTGKPAIWALVNPDKGHLKSVQKFVVRATGEEFDGDQTYNSPARQFIDTFQTGAYVWHLFYA